MVNSSRYFLVGTSLHAKGLVELKTLVSKLLTQLVDCKVSNQKSKTGMLWLHFTRYVGNACVVSKVMLYFLR